VAVAVAVIVLILTIPIPSNLLWIGLSVKAEGVIQVDPHQVQKIVVPEAGGILQALRVEDGQRVKAGDEIAVFTNPDLEIKIRVNQNEKASRQIQEAELTNEWIKAGPTKERVTQDLATVTKEIEALEKNLKVYEAEKKQLTLHADRDGIVMKLIKKDDKGKALEKGSPICEIGEPNALQAILLVPPNEHQLIQANSRAWIRVHGRGYNFWPAKVKDIATVESKDVPPQLSNKASGDIPTQQDPETRQEKPQSQHYAITVSFDEVDDAIQPGTMCRVKIETKSRTLWWRFRRYLTNTFNWGL
jgi:putative peptide zinc metalloprotease protein